MRPDWMSVAWAVMVNASPCRAKLPVIMLVAPSRSPICCLRVEPTRPLMLNACSARIRSSWFRSTTAYFCDCEKNTVRSSGTASERYNSVSENVNASLTGAFHKQFGDIIARGQARYQFEDRHSEWFEAWGSNLGTEDILTLGTTDPVTRSSDSQIEDIRSNFFYLVGAADYKGRYIVDGLLRWDGSSLFGPDERWNTYYRASAAWRLAQEPWWFADAIGEFKLRFSYGTAGNRPSFEAQYETYTVTEGTFMPQDLGNKKLKPEFAREIEAGLRPPEIAVGNLEAVRDFLDVEDVVDAYVRLLDPEVPAGPYNVASGKGTSIRELLDSLLADTSIRPEVKVEQARWRPADTSVGSSGRLAKATGWAPTTPLQETLKHLLDRWRETVGAA